MIVWLKISKKKNQKCKSEWHYVFSFIQHKPCTRCFFRRNFLIQKKQSNQAVPAVGPQKAEFNLSHFSWEVHMTSLCYPNNAKKIVCCCKMTVRIWVLLMQKPELTRRLCCLLQHDDKYVPVVNSSTSVQGKKKNLWWMLFTNSVNQKWGLGNKLRRKSVKLMMPLKFLSTYQWSSPWSTACISAP